MIQPHGFLAADGTDGGILSVGRTVQHIAPPDEAFEKVVKVAADTNALVNGLPHEVIGLCFCHTGTFCGAL